MSTNVEVIDSELAAQNKFNLIIVQLFVIILD